jgi:Arc/MetJ family transcription regulator
MPPVEHRFVVGKRGGVPGTAVAQPALRRRTMTLARILFPLPALAVALSGCLAPSEPSLSLPYEYGSFVWMKKTLHIDQALLQEAKAACGARSDTETVRLGLEALLRHAAYERLRALRGSEPLAAEVPRRRDKASPRRRVA